MSEGKVFAEADREVIEAAIRSWYGGTAESIQRFEKELHEGRVHATVLRLLGRHQSGMSFGDMLTAGMPMTLQFIDYVAFNTLRSQQLLTTALLTLSASFLPFVLGVVLVPALRGLGVCNSPFWAQLLVLIPLGLAAAMAFIIGVVMVAVIPQCGAFGFLI